jgi:hypothetical protein
LRASSSFVENGLPYVICYRSRQQHHRTSHRLSASHQHGDQFFRNTNTLKTNFPVDPTHNGQFFLTTANARELGLTSYSGTDSTITLNSSDHFTWSQFGAIASGTYDAVGAIEHEISEALGRTAFLGKPENQLFGGSITTPVYNILDMFHYSAAGGSSNAAPGSAAGALDEPFVAGYNASVQGYFSFNGSTVTLPFGSPAEIAAGDDVADWKSTVLGDSFGFASAGVKGAVSAVDLETLAVLGYSEVSCFCAGTRIRTACGEAAVEALQRGDLVMTHDGRTVPVSWIGVQTVSRRFADPLRVLPIPGKGRRAWRQGPLSRSAPFARSCALYRRGVDPGGGARQRDGHHPGVGDGGGLCLLSHRT